VCVRGRDRERDEKKEIKKYKTVSKGEMKGKSIYRKIE
jgi:hypothetical protein